MLFHLQVHHSWNIILYLLNIVISLICFLHPYDTILLCTRPSFIVAPVFWRFKTVWFWLKTTWSPPVFIRTNLRKFKTSISTVCLCIQPSKRSGCERDWSLKHSNLYKQHRKQSPQRWNFIDKRFHKWLKPVSRASKSKVHALAACVSYGAVAPLLAHTLALYALKIKNQNHETRSLSCNRNTGPAYGIWSKHVIQILKLINNRLLAFSKEAGNVGASLLLLRI